MTLSIVTVCLNAEKSIKNTVESVLNQSFEDYEYIIIDGGSCDNTLKIIKGYKNRFQSKNIAFQIYSEKDSGIYNAMNKSLEKVQGKWVCFLNAGDVFYNRHTLKKMDFDTEKNDILYGDTVIKYPYPLYKKIPSSKISDIVNKMAFCHQSSFVTKELLVKYRFNESYFLAADYDLFLKLYENKNRFYKCNQIISVCDGTGPSSYDECRMLSEYNEIRFRHSIIGNNEYRINCDKVVRLKKRKRFLGAIKRLIPAKAMNWIHNTHWYWKLVKDGYKRDIF